MADTPEISSEALAAGLCRVCVVRGVGLHVYLQAFVCLVVLEGLLGFSCPFRPFYAYTQEYQNDVSGEGLACMHDDVT